MRTRRTWAPISILLAACGAPGPAAQSPTTTSTPPSAATPAAAAPEPLASPQIQLGAPNHATAFGEPIAFDGIAEGLMWPSLARAFAAKAPGSSRVVLAAPRDARTLDVLRAVWTLREVDVEVQTLGPGNEARPLVLAKRPAKRPDGPTCHAAVFVGSEGKLRVALPGGPVGVQSTAELVSSLAAGARHCSVRWIAVGAETTSEAWGGVFDVAYTVQASYAVGIGRVVLGEPLIRK